MKKTILIIALVVVLTIIAVFVGISIINSPEYALMQIAEDVKDSGIDGLYPHLTDDAQEVVDTITTISESKLFNSIMSFLGKEDYAGILKSNLAEIEWAMSDILKGDKKAKVVLDFNYQDKLAGTIELDMISEDEGWKISGLDMPEFDKVDF